RCGSAPAHGGPAPRRFHADRPTPAPLLELATGLSPEHHVARGPRRSMAMNWLTDVLHNDPDPTETREWIESLKAVIDHSGPERAHQLLQDMVELTRRAGAHLPF